MATQPGAATAGLLSRESEEIARVLAALHAAGAPVFARLRESGEPFLARILKVDLRGRCLFISAHADREVNALFLSRSRVILMADLETQHVEFAAGDPQPAELGGRRAIRLAFPDVVVRHPRRGAARAAVAAQPLVCIADEQGPASFEGRIVDIGPEGIGFLVYASSISLEPGTLLRGCRIELPGGVALHTDLEVRYSRPVKLTDGRGATRSGCRFVDPGPLVGELIRAFNTRES
jgi:hypothetical protein